MDDDPRCPWERAAAHALAAGVSWPKTAQGGDPVVAGIEIGWNELVDAVGPPTFPDEILDGLGPMEVWTLGWPCGCEVALWRIHHHGGAREPTGVDVLSNDSDVAHVLHHLSLPGEVSWRADTELDERRPRAPERFRLVRQDDNGNRVVMRVFDSKLAAECAQSTYERRGHKQLYMIEPVTNGP